MADALASGASVLYGRGGSSPPSPTVKILGSVKASEDFLFLVAVGVGLGGLSKEKCVFSGRVAVI